MACYSRFSITVLQPSPNHISLVFNNGVVILPIHSRNWASRKPTEKAPLYLHAASPIYSIAQGGSGHTSWEAPISVEWTQTQGRSLLLMLPAFRVFRSLSQAIELFPSSLRQETGTDQSIRKWFSAFVPLLSLLGMMLI